MRRIAGFVFLLFSVILLTACGMHRHSFTEQTVSPTCGYGYTLYTCTGCGYSYTDSFDTSGGGHDYEKMSVSGSCTGPGIIRWVCRRCGQEKCEECERLPHDYREEKALPTKDTPGVIQYTCKGCGYSYEEITCAPLGYSAGLRYEKIGTATVRLTGIGECRDEDIVVPYINEYNYRVVEIADGAISGDVIKSLTVRKGVQRVCPGAVRDCPNLTEIRIDGGTRVEKNAFIGLCKLQFLSMSFDKEIAFLFAGRVPDTLTEIEVVGELYDFALIRTASLLILRLTGNHPELSELALEQFDALLTIISSGRIIYSNGEIIK